MRAGQTHILIRLRHAAGIDSARGRRGQTGRTHKVIHRQRLVRKCGGGGRNCLRVRGFVRRPSAGCSTRRLVVEGLGDDIVLLAIAAASAVPVPCAHPMQRRWTTCARRRDGSCGPGLRRTAAGSIVFPGCRFVGGAAGSDAVSMRARSLGAGSCSVSRCAIGVARSSYVAHTQRTRRLRYAACNEQRENQRKPQRFRERHSARGSLRARVVLRLAEPPLRHHHHNLYKVAAKPPSLFRVSSSTSAR